MEAKQKQMNVSIPAYLHKEIRIAAAHEGISISNLVIQALIQLMQKRSAKQ